jgi:hypothetical protein
MTSTVMSFTLGRSSRSSSRFSRLILATRPDLTESPPVANTMGIVAVAALAAICAPAVATSRLTLRPTRSATTASRVERSRTDLYCEHHGKSLSVDHWEETCELLHSAFSVRYLKVGRSIRSAEVHPRSCYVAEVPTTVTLSRSSITSESAKRPRCGATLPLAKWETVSGRFGGYLTGCHAAEIG